MFSKFTIEWHKFVKCLTVKWGILMTFVFSHGIVWRGRPCGHLLVIDNKTSMQRCKKNNTRQVSDRQSDWSSTTWLKRADHKREWILINVQRAWEVDFYVISCSFQQRHKTKLKIKTCQELITDNEWRGQWPDSGYWSLRTRFNECSGPGIKLWEALKIISDLSNDLILSLGQINFWQARLVTIDT